MINIGLVGCGRVTATRHLPALRRIAGARVTGLADVEVGRLHEAADTFGIRSRYSSARALLDDPNIDVVGVCVPAESHSQIAVAALDAGKHVFVEKPLALSLDQADQIIGRAKRSARKAMVGFNLRFHRLMRQARTLLQSGVLGDIEAIRTAQTANHKTLPDWRTRRATGGGVLFEQAVHHFDAWRFLLNSEVERVGAIIHSGLWEDETATVTAWMRNGVAVSSVFSACTGASNELEIYGRNGRLSISCYRADGLVFFPATAVPGLKTRAARGWQALKSIREASPSILRGGIYQDSFRCEWEHFLSAIRDDTDVESSLEDGREALRTILAVVHAAATGQAVRVEEAPRTVSSPVLQTV